jgi:hypothetical protein
MFPRKGEREGNSLPASIAHGRIAGSFGNKRPGARQHTYSDTLTML